MQSRFRISHHIKNLELSTASADEFVLAQPGRLACSESAGAFAFAEVVMPDRSTIDLLQREAHVLQPNDKLTPLLDQIGDASLVLLGEATHGTREFYRVRADISKRLISERGFDAIAVEADWPDTLRVNRYIRHDDTDDTSASASEISDARAALDDFARFPQWMWRNPEIVELIEWLRAYNAQVPDTNAQAGFFGLDLYSLRSSMAAVIRYLTQVDPEAAARARARYGCFDHMADDPQRYGYAASFGLKKNCEDEVVRELIELSSRTCAAASECGDLFYAQQNARVAQNAEAYYRAMFLGRDESWNLRDTHMVETLHALHEHIGLSKTDRAKIVVWAHNSHIGDARATEMGDHGQLNLGQLARQRFGTDEVFLLGLTTHAGTVTAASDWDGPAEHKTVRPSHPDSYERLFHLTGLGNFFLPIRNRPELLKPLGQRHLERAIGVLYLPGSERLSHYFHADLARQFDAIIHFDHTHALQPLDKSPHWQHEEVPDTYPTGM
jgi:erythromycin esterase-like protein